MPLEFTKCEKCGKIFPAREVGATQCPACRGVSAELSDKDLLRQLKNTLRDVQSKGEFLDIPQLSAASKVEEDKIWHFINSGDISTASVDDPAVRDFLIRKKREQAKLSKKIQGDESKQTSQQKFYSKKSSGFHHSGNDAKKK